MDSNFLRGNLDNNIAMRYTIKKGNQSWRPRPILPKLLFGFDCLTWTVTPDKYMEFDYIDPATGDLDNDWNDWKKIGGISLVNWKNPQNVVVKNRDAIMLAWRWNPTISVHEFAVYVNEKGGRVVYEEPHQVLRTIAGTSVSMEVTKNDKSSYNARLYVTSKGPDSVNRKIIETRQEFCIYSLINPWYGGANNAPGRWGGRAPKDMEMELEFRKS